MPDLQVTKHINIAVGTGMVRRACGSETGEYVDAGRLHPSVIDKAKVSLAVEQSTCKDCQLTCRGVLRGSIRVISLGEVWL